MFEIFQLPFMQAALASSTIIGLMCSFLGVYVVLRRIIFVGIALAQVSALGVATAVYFEQDLALFAFIFTVAGVLLFSPEFGGKKLPQEAIIGISFVTAWAGSILILSKAAHGEASMLNLVQGNILGTTGQDIHHLLWVFVPVTLIHILFYRQFLFTSFDPVMASTLSVSSKIWNFIFYLTLGLVVAVSIKVAGVLLAFSFLVIPAITALTIVNKMRANFIVAGISAVLASFVGLVLSFYLDLPTGPAIVGISFVLFFIVFCISTLINYVTSGRKVNAESCKTETPVQTQEELVKV
jgi:ABC-type Mn2+/Zn2+ transport system permease subunit